MLFIDDPQLQLLLAGGDDLGSIIGGLGAGVSGIFIAVAAKAARRKKIPAA